MSVFSVMAAGIAAWIFGAVWYSVFAKQWVVASGVATDADGKPANQKNPVPYVLSVAAAIAVAGMMRHTFILSDITTIGKALVSGFGIGAFLASPWIVTCYAFAGRPAQLMLIDGGYTTFGCTVIGIVLVLI